MLAAFLPVTVVVLAPPAAAATNTVTLNLVNARSTGNVVKGDPIASGKKFTWLITADDTGDPNQAVADCVPSASNPDPLRDTSSDGTGHSFCQWPSIRTTPGNVPVIASGDQGDTAHQPSRLGARRRYLISVLADGYALGGAHFTAAAQLRRDGAAAALPDPAGHHEDPGVPRQRPRRRDLRGGR